MYTFSIIDQNSLENLKNYLRNSWKTSHAIKSENESTNMLQNFDRIIRYRTLLAMQKFFLNFNQYIKQFADSKVKINFPSRKFEDQVWKKYGWNYFSYHISYKQVAFSEHITKKIKKVKTYSLKKTENQQEKNKSIQYI